MLQNAYLVAKIGADTAENERNFAQSWQLPHGSISLRPLAGPDLEPPPLPARGAPRGPAGPGLPRVPLSCFLC